jgi:hypothetical protein
VRPCQIALPTEWRIPAAVLNQASNEPGAQQHLAILELAADLPIPEIFDAILDPADARDLLITIAATANANHLRSLWFASPHLSEHAFAGPFAIALLGALTTPDGEPVPEQVAHAAQQASAAATDHERHAALRALRTLTAALGGHHETITQLANTLSTPPAPE